MESPSNSSSGDTPSSSADSTSADSSPVQTKLRTGENPEMECATTTDHDDSASDASMPVETDDEDEETTATAPLPLDSEKLGITRYNPFSSVEAEGSKKRKLSISPATPNGQLESEFMHEDRKRQRSNRDTQVRRTSIPLDRSLLPGEIWHYIFTFCPPRVLGLLLRVNKTFHGYLDPSGPGNFIDLLQRSALKPLPADAIWAACRRLFPLPGVQNMPAPLSGKSELDMWKIACGSLCQFCSKKRKTSIATSIDKWHSGPGENSIAPIFSLGIRSCGTCLQQHLMKVGNLKLIILLPSLY
jgi:hypothetical protein